MNIPTKNDMIEKYGDFYKSANLILINPKNVPQNLQMLIPLVELWGVSDDSYREQLVNEAPKKALNDFTKAIEQFEDELDEWLAGDEADSERYTHEYISFSAMRMASDFA